MSRRHTRKPAEPRRAARRLAAAGRGVLAAVVLVGLLVGVPAALLALGANPLTVRLPSLDRLGQLLTSPDDGTVWLAAARVVGWAGWAGLAVSALVEIAAAVVGSGVPVLRGLGAVQRPAGYLIALATTTLLTPAAAPAVGVAAAQTAAAAPTPPIPHPNRRPAGRCW